VDEVTGEVTGEAGETNGVVPVEGATGAVELAS
jgi:hypothetical protein